MIDAKDVARKIASGCGHGVTVKVPCADCVEQMVESWGFGVREDEKRQVLFAHRDAIQKSEGEVTKHKESTDKLQQYNSKLTGFVAQLEHRVKVLSEALAASKKEADELKLLLHAENAVEQVKSISGRKHDKFLKHESGL